MRLFCQKWKRYSVSKARKQRALVIEDFSSHFGGDALNGGDQFKRQCILFH